MSDNPEDLNYDCNYNMFLAKTLLPNLPDVKARQQAAKWMRKLAESNKSVEEMKLRNDFMYYLVLNIQNKTLQTPFVDDPPADTIMAIAHLMPGATAGASDVGEGAERPFLYSNSPDGGAFLAAQPVPRCGAFCYLAVVSKSKS